MVDVTLILTRNPLKEFRSGPRSGRWGELVAVAGPKISAVTLAPGGGGEVATEGSISVTHGVLQLSSGGGAISSVKRYTSMERFRTNDQKSFYVQLHPQAIPYTVTYETGNSAVKKMRPTHDGRCFRVHGGKVGPEQGILIHEAPQVGWLIGCISPRPLNNFRTEFANEIGNPSYQCMNELFQLVGHSRANLFVLDW
jgi:hypothetical protein